MDKLKEKAQERTAVLGKMNALNEKASDGWTDEQRTEFSNLKKSFLELTSECRKLQEDADNAAFLERAGQDEYDYDRDEVDRKAERRQTGEWSKRQIRDAFLGRFGGRFANEEQRSLAAQMPQRRGPKGGYLMRVLLEEQPTRQQLLDRTFWAEREAEQRAQSVGTDTAGGHFVPDELKREVEITLLDFNALRQAARVIRTSDGVDLSFPTVDDTGNTGVLMSENVQMTELDVTAGETRLEAYSYNSRIVRVSWQLLADSATNVTQMLGRLLGERLGRIQGTHDTTGSGSSQPNGAVTAAADSSVTTASNTAITAAELANIRQSVDNAYQQGASWMFDQVILGYIMSIDSNNALKQSELFSGGSIWGQRYYINNYMATGASAKAILYGDFKQYIVRDVMDMEFIQLDERYADYGQVGFLAWHRHDADLLQSTALKYATLAA